jgi:putative ABC transport system permease protein
LTESMLLAVIGGIAGIAVAIAMLQLMPSVLPSSIPRSAEVTLDWTALTFGLAISVLIGVLFGLVPAIHAARADLSIATREGARGSGHGVRTARSRDALIVLELAIAVVLMIGAGLLLKTFRELLRENPGFNPTHVVTAKVNLPFPGDPKNDPYQTLAKQVALYREMGRRMSAIPGVERVGFASHLPTSRGITFSLRIEDRPSSSGDDLHARELIVNPEYFRVMQAPLARGRFFTEDDQEGKTRVAIVDKSTARRYWPDRDALGRRLRMGDGAWMTIVGVVNDIKQDGLDTTGLPHVYVPMYQDFDVADGYVFRDAVVLLRTSLPASVLDPLIRDQVHAVDPTLPVYDVTSMNDVLDRSLGARRFAVQLVGGFAVLSLLLASIGIYGVLAYMVGQRSHELGIRMALGATRKQILGLILGRGAMLAGVGVVAGVLLSASVASMIASLLYGVHPHDPAVFLAVPMLLLGVSVLASYLPARRATRIDPMRALRDA